MNFATKAPSQNLSLLKISYSLLLCALLLLSGCGASTSSDRSISYHGIVVSPEGKALPDVLVYIYETAESSNTDQSRITSPDLTTRTSA